MDFINKLNGEYFLLVVSIMIVSGYLINVISKRDNNKFFKAIYNVIIVPTIFLTTIFIAFVINSFFSNDGTNLPVAIKFLVDNRAYAVLLIVFWIFFYFGYNYLTEQGRVVDNLNKVIEIKDKQIETNAGILEAKYGEFAESIHKKNINKILELVVNKFAIVEACHLYKYNLLRIENSIKVKVNFLYGEEQEGTCINVIKQIYYNIDKDIYNTLFDFKKRLLEGDIDVVERVPDIYDMIENSFMHESVKIRLVEFIIITLNSVVGVESTLPGELIDEIDGDRSAILTSILSNSGYIYEYHRYKFDKQGRVYFVSPIVLDNGYIVNICIDGENSDMEDINEIFKEIVIFIIKEYNKIKGGDRNEER